MLHRYSVLFRRERKQFCQCSILGNGDGDLDMAHRLVTHYLKQNPKVSDHIMFGAEQCDIDDC